MSYAPKEGFGTLFKNKNQVEGKNHPDRVGEVMWKGQILKVSGWVKQDKNGNQYLSLSIQEKT